MLKNSIFSRLEGAGKAPLETPKSCAGGAPNPSRPGEVLLAGSEGEVALDDAQVDLQARSNQARPGRHPVAAELKAELLLVDRRRREERRLDALSEPLRGIRGRPADLGGGLAFAGAALRLSVAEGDDDDLPLPRRDDRQL